MRIKKSIEINGWIGFFSNDEDGHPEEFMTIKTLKRAEEIIKQLQNDIKNLKEKKIKNG